MALKTDFEVMELQSAHCHKRERQDKDFRVSEYRSAAAAIGELTRDCEIFGFTKGQFGITEILRHLIRQIGACSLDIATWTASESDIRQAERLLKDQKIKKLRFLVDPSFKSRKPKFCAALVDAFGNEALRTVRIHAKFAILRNKDWNLAVRTSMNLNPNKRLEYFEISDDSALADFFSGIMDEIFSSYSAEENFGSQEHSEMDRMGFRGGKKRAAITDLFN
jgi:hypothetical protein